MDEIWKDIEGYENDYQVSNLGRVKSLPKKCWNGKGYWFRDGRILTPVKSKKGYLNVWCRKNIFKVHRLVANAFIPNPQNLPQVNHIDGDKTNNCVANLEWVTDGENLLHAYRVLGRKQKTGKNHHNSRAVIQLKDGKIINLFDSLNEAARATGAHFSVISLPFLYVLFLHFSVYLFFLFFFYLSEFFFDAVNISSKHYPMSLRPYTT